MTTSRRPAMVYVAPVLALVLICGLATLSNSVSPQPCPTSWEPGSAAVASKDSHGNAVLYNGFVCVEVSSGLGARVVWASADFEGRGQYGKNVLGPDGIQTLHFPENAFSTLTVESSGVNGTEAVVSIVDKAQSGSAQETWTVKLGKLSRSFELRTAGFVTADPNSPAPCRLWDMSPASIYAWYDDAQDGESVVQMKYATAEKSHFSSKTRLKRVYALGANNHEQHPTRLETGAVGNRSIDILLEGGRQVTTLGSGFNGVKLFEHIGGEATLVPEATVWDEWAAALSSVENRQSLSWDYSAHVGVNSYDFPVAELGTGPNLPTDDLRAFMTGIYASPAGVLSTHMNAVVPGVKVAQMATTISMPFHGYEGNYNFFDPDDYIATAALLWSNDPFLQRQVRSVLERSGQFLKNESGLLPHHFVKDVPVYAALSDEVQTGPNLFWILSCLNYAKTSGDKTWLESYMPTIRHAAKFLDNLVDPQVGLAKVPGSLMIDIFLRSNFTTDTNAMLVGFLSEFAAAEEWIGDHARASHLRDLSQTIKSSLRKYLWDPIDNDHFVTQWDYPVNTTRDFVDYDANLIALAHGIVSQEEGEKVLARIDKGPCMTTTASWVSEKYYGKNETAHGNIGDSSCAMARIAWFDALARKRYGGVQVFNDRILGLIKKELFSSTWMHERLRCDGSQDVFRTFGYFEYPSTAAMLIKAVRYGIKMEYGKVVVDPFGPRKFDYDIHGIRIHYDPDEVTELFIDGTGPRQFTVAGLLENTPYNVQVSAFNYNFSSTSDGVISFDAQAGELVKVTRLHLIEIPQALEA